MNRPKLGPKEVVYRTPYQQIYRVQADFEEFQKEYFVADNGSRAAILMVREGHVLLVRQYRLLIDGLSWEIPGGRVEPNEEPEDAAVRECLEETGLLCSGLNSLLEYHMGLDTTLCPTHIFFTDTLVESEKGERDGREVSHQEWISLERCFDMIRSREIVDSLSILALLSFHRWEMGDQS